MKHQALIPHLFRTEFGKITTVLCKHLGIAHMEGAEDIASETFLTALETWPYKGIPENPTAWLYAVAKNKAVNHIRRHHLFTEKVAPQVMQAVTRLEIEIDLSAKSSTDSQLQMLFAIGHPSLSTEAQIGLALRILCGFGIDEIATAFLTNKQTINKRLFRAREKLRLEKATIAVPGPAEIDNRLDIVLQTLYLVFSEGYYSESRDAILREDFCLEAMRLTYLLIENDQTNRPAVNALLSLMCFHASRFEARRGENGALLLYQEQDASRWNYDLIMRGSYYLKRAAQGNRLSKYHLEASIAYWHTIKEDTTEKWTAILQLFNQLLQLEYSPIAALNRTYALSKVKSKGEALIEAEKLQLTNNHFYFMLLGELYKDLDNNKAKTSFQKAYSLAKTRTEKQTILKQLEMLC